MVKLTASSNLRVRVSVLMDHGRFSVCLKLQGWCLKAPPWIIKVSSLAAVSLMTHDRSALWLRAPGAFAISGLMQ